MTTHDETTTAPQRAPEKEPETTRPETANPRTPTKKAFAHFQDPSVVPVLLQRLRARHGCSAEALAERIVSQMKAWFEPMSPVPAGSAR